MSNFSDDDFNDDLPFSPVLDDQTSSNKDSNIIESNLQDSTTDNEKSQNNTYLFNNLIFSNEENNKKEIYLEQSKNNININKKYYMELLFTKGNRILPIVAFLFVFVLGIYLFIGKANASNYNLIKIEENSKIGYINDIGEKIVKPKYLYGTDYYKGYAVTKNYNNLYGIINNKGDLKIPFGNIFSAILYDNIYIISKFTNDGLKMGLLDEQLNEITRIKYDTITYSKSGVFIFTRDETMGIMNNEGKEIYTYIVDEVDDRNISIEISNLNNKKFDRYAKIKVNSSSTIININTGKEVYRYILDDIYVLDNNVFYIKNKEGNNKYFIIKNDKIIYETTDYKRIRIEDISSNIAIGIKENTDIEYINLIEQKVINIKDDAKYTYSDGVILKEKYDFNLKKNIYTIYTPSEELGSFSDVKPYDNKFVNGFMKIITSNNKYSFVNKKGKIITEKEYEFVSDFNKMGYAIISNDNLYGIINSKGKEILKEKYDEILFINDTLFKNVKNVSRNELFIFKENNKYGIINSDGKIVIKPIYNSFENITTKYPFIEGNYNDEKVIINLNTLKELSIKVIDDIEIYNNYIICSDNYYNFNGEKIYSLGGNL